MSGEEQPGAGPASSGQSEADELERYFDLSQDLHSISTLDGRFLRLSAAWETALGYSRQELMASRYLDFVHPEDLAGTVREMGRLGEGRDVTGFVNRYRRRDGRYLFMEWRSRRIGERVYGVARDITEQVEARRRQRQSEALYLAAFQQAPFPTTLATFDEGRILEVNLAFERVTGLSRAEVVGRTSIEVGFVTPEQRAAMLEELTKRGSVAGLPWRTTLPRRRAIDWEYYGTVLEIEGRACILAMHVDVTDRLRLERERGTMLEMYRAIQRPGSLGELVEEAEGLFRRWSGQAGVRIRMGAEVEVGEGDVELRAAAGRLGVVELRGEELSGELREVLERRAASLGTAIAQRQSREALEESEYWLQESQAIARVGSYRFDARTGMWRSSPELDRIFGIDASFPHDTGGWGLVLHPEERGEMLQYLVEQVLTKGMRFDREYRIVRVSDGAERWVHGRGAVRRDETGAVVEMFGTIQDITERRIAEAQQEELEGQLQQAQKLESIGRLAGGVAHDFNNLLTVINGYGQLLLEMLPEGDRSRRPLEEICRAGERAAALTKQLLAFSRKQILEPKLVGLNELIRQSRDMFGRMLGEMVELRVELAPELGMVLTDPNQIHQVLMNLLVNARDAMPDGGRVVLGTGNRRLSEAEAEGLELGAGLFAEVTVRDTGCGMEPQVLERIFEPFFTTKEEGKGTGLGLSTVYGIVRQCGGAVQVESVVGEGTVFRILLPRVDAPRMVESVEESERAERGTERVLVVEDQESVRGLAVEVLASYGYQVLAAAGGEAALEMVGREAGSIDLVLSDVVMPGMTGPELAKRLRARWPEVKVLFMSGHTSDQSIVRGGFLGAGVEVVQKPFRPDLLAARVRQTLGLAKRAPRVLWAGGESGESQARSEMLKRAGYEVVQAESSEVLLGALGGRRYEAALVSVRVCGEELVEEIVRRSPGLRLILLCRSVEESAELTGRLAGVCAGLVEPVSEQVLLMAMRQVLSGRTAV